MPPLVSVIVVNFNRADLLSGCVDSVLKQSYPRIEILVVDNGSQDGSCSRVRRRYGDRVRLIQLDENRGFAGGVNAGLAQVRGDLVALLNNDARARPDWLQLLVEAVSQSPRVGMGACKVLLDDGKTIDKAGHLLFPDGQNRGRGTGQKDHGQFDRPEEVLFPDGCAALYRRRLLEETGGLDRDFFAYADDADLGLRARWLNWTCVYVPESVVYHRQSSTTDVYAPEKVYWVERNRLWLAVKNFPLPLLLLNPLFTLYRWSWNALAALAGSGASGSFRRRHTWTVGAGTILRALGDGIWGLPGMWKKRRAIRAARRISDWEFLKLIWQYRISARQLAFQDRRDSGA